MTQPSTPNLTKSSVATQVDLDVLRASVAKYQEDNRALKRRIARLERQDHVAELAFHYGVLVLIAVAGLLAGALSGDWGWLFIAAVLGFWAY